MVLFDSWIDKSAGTGLDRHAISNHEALRYKNVVATSAGAVTSPVSMDAGATHVAFVDGNGSVANGWVSNGAWQGPSGLGGTSR
ncbi:hypothetical protein [Streptomyces erythrochromogenes]|uniref:hypothetical protein n=1 Tax=Streptomyces erythrochromogenes TaxID=285574 RepID=UPI0037FCE8AD